MPIETRELRSLQIKNVGHLCFHLGTNRKQLEYIGKNIEKYYWRSERVSAKGKIRKIATPIKELRQISDRLEQLLQRVALPDSLHGGIKKRSCISNALPHTRQPILLKFDVKDFFPSISSKRVYRLFIDLGCSPDVARYLTRISTLDGAVPQGSPTSTTIANLVVSQNMANRLKKLSESHGAKYSQFVDDISISGPEYLERLSPLVAKIIRQEGFRDHSGKREVIRTDKEQVVTGVKINDGKDVQSKTIKAVRAEIEALTASSAQQNNVSKTINSIKGKINYIYQLNKGAAKSLRKRLNSALKDQPKQILT